MQLSQQVTEDLVAEAGAIAVSEESPTALSSTAATGWWRRATRAASSGRAAIAIQGSAWSIGGYVATQLLRTLTTLILARHFLGPETFGIVGLVGVFLAGLSMFSELGIVTNIVQHPRGDDPRFLNTAFSIQAGRGLFIWAAAALAAYPFALFYKQPELFPLLVVAGLAELVRGLTSTASWTLTRHVKLRDITLLTLAGEIVAFGVGVLWAVVSPSAWALIARTIASAAVYTLGSYFIAKPVRFGWDRLAAKDILHFGGWMSLSTAAYFMGGQGERLILGKFITPAELGCFSLALMISAVPAGGIGQLVNQIYLPMLSATVRTGRVDMVRDFRQARRLFFGLALFAGMGFLVCGKPFVALLLNPKYAMAGWMLQVLGLRVALDIFSAPGSSLLLAHAKTKFLAAGNTCRLICMAAGIWIAFSLSGIRQAVLALVIAQAFSYFPLIVGIHKCLPELGQTELRWYGAFLGVLVVAAAMLWPR